MFAVKMKIDLLFARSSSLSRPASLDLGLFTKPSGIQLFTCLSSFIKSHGNSSKDRQEPSPPFHSQAGSDPGDDVVHQASGGRVGEVLDEEIGHTQHNGDADQLPNQPSQA